MKDSLLTSFSYMKEYWLNKTRKQKILMASSLIVAIIVILGISYAATKTTFVPLYSNLKPSETGSIKENLDSRGIKSEITDGGSTIKVPDDVVETLKVELAAEGIPKSGNIDYSFFGENAGFGMTDNEFNILKLDAIQNELSELMQSIDGIEQAKVMINLPEKGIFVSDRNEEASASIILQTDPGYEFNEKQIKSLYYLVSKSVPNLPTENIIIRNQFLDYFDLNETAIADGGFDQQMKIKERVERDIQRQVQQMLGTLMGFDKVVTSVTADIDFTQENREENIVTPVDEENMRGIQVSAQRITETFSGDEEQAGGVPQASDPADSGVTQYLEGSGAGGDYERSEETLNYEINKIRKEIVESPYKIRDLGIQVMVEPPDPEQPASFPQERVEDIQELLATIVRTSIDKDSGTDISNDAIRDKVIVSVQPFNGKIAINDQMKQGTAIPWWGFLIAGILLSIIAALIVAVMRNRKADEPIDDYNIQAEKQEPIADINEKVVTDSSMQLHQLEILAKENPEEFANLIRNWMIED